MHSDLSEELNSCYNKLDLVKSIDEIYHEVSGHDIILTNDAPLSSAINIRASKEISYTPGKLALKISEERKIKIYSHFEIVNQITKLEKRSVKVIHQYTGSILQMMYHSSSMEEVFEFASPEEKKLIPYFEKYPVLEKIMMDFDNSYYENEKVAVINEESFKLLDKLFIPSGFNYTKVNIFKEQEFEISRTFVFNSSKDLLDKTVDLITPDNMNQTAIVISLESENNFLLKARLKSKGIKTIEKFTLGNESSVNLILNLADLGVRYKDLLAADIFSFAGNFNIRLKKRNSNSTLKELLALENNKKLNELAKLLSGIETLTFTRFAEKLTADFSMEVSEIYYTFLKDSQIDKIKISEFSLIELKYMIRNFDFETGGSDTGVLLADPCSSAYIDRENVICLELDNTWMKNIPERIYYDRSTEELRAFNNFKCLLQQGKKHLNFVKIQSFGDKTIPCYYFNYFMEIKDFNASFFDPVRVKSDIPGKINYVKILDRIPETEDSELRTISPSSLKIFYTCPKKYEFSKLAGTEDSPPMFKGTLIHEYAEMYFHHPVFCKEHRAEILKNLTDKFKKKFDSINRDYAETEFSEAMRSIESFLNKKKFKRIPFEPGFEPDDFNNLMEEFKLKKILRDTEVKISSEKSYLHGKIDLRSDLTIVDFKSGKTKKKLLDDNLVSFINECENVMPDFQAISYIKMVFDDCSDEEQESNALKIDMYFYHMLCNMEEGFQNPSINSSGKSSSKNELKDPAINKVRFYNMTFNEFLLSDDFKNICASDGKNLHDLFGDNYSKMVSKLNIPVAQYFNLGNLSEDLFAVSEKYFDPKVKTKEDAATILKYILKMRRGSETKDITDECSFFLFREDLEEFSDMVKLKIGEINLSNQTVFKAQPIFLNDELCKNCEYLSMCSKNILSNAPELNEI